MNLANELMGQAKELFNVSGISKEKAGSVIIFGLESTKDRNLDKMGFKDGSYQSMPGWTEHIKPRLTVMIDLLRSKDYEAEPVGFWGYPRGEMMQLKHIAVMAGLGQQGKNTLLLESTFGHRLRLAALRTNAPLTPTGSDTYDRRENPLCESCSACIDACPVEGLLEPYRLLEPTLCLCNINNMKERDGLAAPECNEACRIACPICR